MNNADLFKGVIHDWQIYVRYSNVTAMRYPYIIMNSANDISFIETFGVIQTYTQTEILIKSRPCSATC